MKKIIEKYSGKPSNLFKKLFVTFLFGYFPFTLLQIILNITGVLPINFNNEKIYGLKGLIVLILFSPFIVLMITIFVWLYFVFGNFVLRLLKRYFYE